MKILILGANGMLGHALFNFFSKKLENQVFGTIRLDVSKAFFPSKHHKNLISGVDLNCLVALSDLLQSFRPDLIINCVGLTKHNTKTNIDFENFIQINSLLPHRLSYLAAKFNSRLILFSTDCVFSGLKGNYLEKDVPDPVDFYGESKVLGECYSRHVLTIRTSIIGHELGTCNGLLEWFLSQANQCKGYDNAYFSGFPTSYIPIILEDYIFKNNTMHGIFHISSDRISKFNLLTLIKEIYALDIEIIPDRQLVIDRSLNGKLFSKKTGFKAPSWYQLIKFMKNSFLENKSYYV